MSELGPDLAAGLSEILDAYNAANERADGNGEQWSPQLWRQVGRLGFPLSLVAEENGGIGADTNDLFALLCSAGRHAPPIPLAEPLLAGWLWQGVPGANLVTVAFPDNDRDLDVTLMEEEVRLSGRLAAVPWGRYADTVLYVVAIGDDGLIIPLKPAAGRIDPDHNLAGEPADTLHFEVLSLPLAACRRSDRGPEALRNMIALCYAAQMVGAMEGTLSLTLDYVKERRQFGRPIARFQAIQHSMARMAAEIAAARMAVQAGFISSQPWTRTFAAAAAKSRVSEAVKKVAAIAHQAHGAMGFTAEYRLHLFTKRMWAWRESGGNEFYWNERLEWLIVERSELSLWALLTAQDN